MKLYLTLRYVIPETFPICFPFQREKSLIRLGSDKVRSALSSSSASLRTAESSGGPTRCCVSSERAGRSRGRNQFTPYVAFHHISLKSPPQGESETREIVPTSFSHLIALLFKILERRDLGINRLCFMQIKLNESTQNYYAKKTAQATTIK